MTTATNMNIIKGLFLLNFLAVGSWGHSLRVNRPSRRETAEMKIMSTATTSISSTRDGHSCGFLVSNIDTTDELWCIVAPTTTSNGTTSFPLLGFNLCDFEGQPMEQLWAYDEANMTLKSCYSYEDEDEENEGEDLCMTVGAEGQRTQLGECGLTQFMYNTNGTASPIVFVEEDEEDEDEEEDEEEDTDDDLLCLTNQGAFANATDFIRLQDCRDTGRFFFTFQMPEEEEMELIDPEEDTQSPTTTTTTTAMVTDAPTQTDMMTTTMPPTVMATETETETEMDTDAPTSATTIATTATTTGTPTVTSTTSTTSAPTTMTTTTNTATSAPTTTNTVTTSSAPTTSSTSSSTTTTEMPTAEMMPTANAMDFMGLVNVESDGGCLVVEDEEPVSGQSLMLGECDEENHDWRYEEDTGLLRTFLDDTMCMQVGHVGVRVEEGVRMRLYPCDPEYHHQVFDYYDDNGSQFRLRNREGGAENLCVGHSGETPDVGSDDLIMKPCDFNGVAWNWED